MTDRELLELAAKAAGIGGQYEGPDGAVEAGIFFNDGHDCLQWWNPLTDDGDALRLAVKLRINVEHMKTLGGAEYGVNCWPIGRGDCGVSEDESTGDYEAATRRAIVRAAAEIGRSIK